MWSGNSDNIVQQIPRNYMYQDKVFILEEITTDTCAYLIGDLTTFVFNQDNRGRTLTFIINSPGGDVSVMMNIIGLMNIAKIYDIEVITFVLGQAGSAASLIAAHGTMRCMSRVATHFIHFGSIFNITTKHSEIEKTYIQNIEYSENMKSLYLEACGGKLTRTKLEKLQSDERGYLNAKDCITYGLADCIVEDDLTEKRLNEKERFEFEKLFAKHKLKKAKEIKNKLEKANNKVKKVKVKKQKKDAK